MAQTFFTKTSLSRSRPLPWLFSEGREAPSLCLSERVFSKTAEGFRMNGFGVSTRPWSVWASSGKAPILPRNLRWVGSCRLGALVCWLASGRRLDFCISQTPENDFVIHLSQSLNWALIHDFCSHRACWLVGRPLEIDRIPNQQDMAFWAMGCWLALEW